MPSRRPLPSKPGSPEDDAKLLELLQRGSKPKLIAARLRQTLGAVRSRKAILPHSANPEPGPAPDVESRHQRGAGAVPLSVDVRKIQAEEVPYGRQQTDR